VPRSTSQEFRADWNGTQKGRRPVPTHLPLVRTLILAGVVMAVPTESAAQRHGWGGHAGAWHGGGGHGGGWHGGGWHGGGWHGGGGYGYRLAHYGYRYGGYPYYAGYARYRSYYGYPGFYGISPWPVFIPTPVYVPVAYVPFPQQPALQQCPDGSAIATGGYCPAPPPVAPPQPAAPPPVAQPSVVPERG
jgi:hypothetical protein